MSTFLLVHGAWHGSWCWKRVRRILQAAGHEVFTPTLTGVGERAHLLSPEVNLETHIADVANLIHWEELSDVILCGHSYAGCVVSAVADRFPEQIRALIYLDAFVPESGQSLHDTLPAEMRNAQVEEARETGDGWQVPPIPAEVFQVNERDREWVNRQCTMQPLATFQQKLELTGRIEEINDISYILAAWQPSPFPQFLAKAKAKGWKTAELRCGHDVMLDLPEELCRELLKAAG